MFKGEAQQCRAIRVLLGSLGMERFWTEKGPTDLALDYLEGSPLSSGEKILLRCAFDFWGGDGNVLLYQDLMGRLDEERTSLVLTLAMAVNMGPAAVDDWIEAQANPQPIQCGQPDRDAQVLVESNTELLNALDELVSAVQDGRRRHAARDLGAIGSSLISATLRQAEDAIRKAKGE
jgi:hypothetical protein